MRMLRKQSENVERKIGEIGKRSRGEKIYRNGVRNLRKMQREKVKGESEWENRVINKREKLGERN